MHIYDFEISFKKWPFEFPEAYYDRKIIDLREEFGIEILKVEDKHFR